MNAHDVTRLWSLFTTAFYTVELLVLSDLSLSKWCESDTAAVGHHSPCWCSAGVVLTHQKTVFAVKLLAIVPGACVQTTATQCAVYIAKL